MDNDNPLSPVSAANLLSLPTEILIQIAKLLQTPDLFNLSRTHSRLKGICSDKRFWENVENPQDIYEVLNEIVNNYVHEGTHTFQLSSDSHGSNGGMTSSLPPSIFYNLKLKSPNLTKLCLIGQKFDGNLLKLKTLPQSLKVLRLTNSSIDVSEFVTIPNEDQPYDIEESVSYFEKIQFYLEDLEELDLESCSWVVALDLIHIRKLRKLVRLNLKGCRFHGNPKTAFTDSPAIHRLQWRRVFSAIASSGFDDLKVLDLSNTDVSRTQFLECFFRNRQDRVLEELYLGYFDAEYIWQLMDRRLTTSPLQFAKKLKILDVSGFVIHTSFIADVSSCPLLREVRVNFTTIPCEVENALPGIGFHKRTLVHPTRCILFHSSVLA